MNVKTELPVRRMPSVLAPERRLAGGISTGRTTRHAEACRACPARCGGFCGTLPDALLRRLSGLAMPAVHKADHWLWDMDGAGHLVVVVRKGFLRLLRYSSYGRRLITGIAGPGAIVGETLPGRGNYGVECATEVSLCAFERNAIERLQREDTRFRRLFHAERRRSLEILHEHIWRRGMQGPEERLAAFIVQACEMLPYQPMPGGGGVLTLAIPRADIADLIGTTRETISRLVHRWQDEGLVAIPDADHLVLPDLAPLAARAALAPSRQLPGGDVPRGVAPPVKPTAPLHYL